MQLPGIFCRYNSLFVWSKWWRTLSSFCSFAHFSRVDYAGTKTKKSPAGDGCSQKETYAALISLAKREFAIPVKDRSRAQKVAYIRLWRHSFEFKSPQSWWSRQAVFFFRRVKYQRRGSSVLLLERSLSIAKGQDQENWDIDLASIWGCEWEKSPRDLVEKPPQPEDERKIPKQSNTLTYSS